MKIRFSHRIAALLSVGVVMFDGSPAATSTPKIVAAPMHNKAGMIDYPRLTRFPDARIRRHINAALAAEEAAHRDQRTECLADLRAQGLEPDKDSFAERIDVSYLSRRYLSIEVHVSYFCGAAYPTNDDPEPDTFDLATGKEIDWSSLFKPGFLPAAGGAGATAPQLGILYQARYATTKMDADLDGPCKGAVAGDDPFSQGVTLWLDGRKGGLVAMPSFPHVIEACAVPLVFSPAEIAPYTVDKAFLEDLKAAGSH